MSGRCIEKLSHSCGSNDGLQVFHDKDGYTGYCFACDTYIPDPYKEGKSPPAKRIAKTPEQVAEEVAEIRAYPSFALPDRKLTKETLEYFGIKVGVSEQDGTTPVFHFYPYKKDGEIRAYKTRLIAGKRIWSVGDMKGVDLFGWDEALATGAKRLYITEGELDAAALYQALKDKSRGTKWAEYNPAVVSLTRGAGYADRDLDTHMAAIRASFKEVVLVFDKDEAGEAATEKALQVCPWATTVALPAKDPNECLIQGRAMALCNAVLFKAEAAKTTRLVAGHTLYEAGREQAKMGMSWPWEGFTRLTRGMRFGETVYIGAGVKMGKALSYSTLVPTPTGETEWRNIYPGDFLFSVDGKPVKVLQRHEQGESDIYCVTFSDGTKVHTTDNHKWVVYDRRGKRAIRTTREMMERGVGIRKNNYTLPLTGPVQYPTKSLTIDPYVLGAWLGDGATGDGRITNQDDEVWNNIILAGYALGKDLSYGRTRCHTVLGISKLLPATKYIPKMYMYSDVKQRLALLQGILDTDGWVEKNGTVMFGSTLVHLRDDVVWLARSLGMIAKPMAPKATGHKIFYKCRITDTHNHILFRIARKQSRCRNITQWGRGFRRVESITYSHREQAMCVTVDAPLHLFLANDFIPTHNSELVNTLAAHLMVEHDIKVFLAKPEEANRKTYQMVLGKVVGRHFHDPDVPFDYTSYDKAAEIVDNKLYMLSLYQHLGWSSLRADIMTAVKQYGCRAIFIDPITNLVNGVASGETNTMLQEIAQELAAMAKDLDIIIFIFCHLKAPMSGDSHERGGKVYSSQFSGSRAMMRSCNLMIGLEGTKDPDLEEEQRNLRKLIILEDREFGASGYIRLFWDRKTGLFNEIKDK